MMIIGAEVANIFMDVVVGGRVLNVVLRVFGLPASVIRVLLPVSAVSAAFSFVADNSSSSAAM